MRLVFLEVKVKVKVEEEEEGDGGGVAAWDRIGDRVDYLISCCCRRVSTGAASLALTLYFLVSNELWLQMLTSCLFLFRRQFSRPCDYGV